MVRKNYHLYSIREIRKRVFYVFFPLEFLPRILPERDMRHFSSLKNTLSDFFILFHFAEKLFFFRVGEGTNAESKQILIAS